MAEGMQSPGNDHQPPQRDGQFKGGKHASDEAYIWGDDEVSMSVDILAAWHAEDTQRLHQITQSDTLDKRFREYAESYLKLIGERRGGLPAVGRIAMDSIDLITAEIEAADKGMRHTLPILPWQGR